MDEQFLISRNRSRVDMVAVVVRSSTGKYLDVHHDRYDPKYTVLC